MGRHASSIHCPAQAGQLNCCKVILASVARKPMTWSSTGPKQVADTIRIHDSNVQQQVFTLLGLDAEKQRDRFGFLLDALQFGAPPHGGIALGIDRWIMLFAGLDNIRDVIAFPKTQKATDLMTEAPGTVDTKQLRELGIELKKRPD